MKTIVQKIQHPTVRDIALSAGYKAANLAKLAQVGIRRGPLRFWRESRQFPWLRSLSRANDLHDRMTRGRTGLYREANAFVITQVISSITGMVQGFFDHPENTVIHEDLVPPEILLGMGLNPWMAEFLGITLPMIDSATIEHYIDVAENYGIPADVCSLPKSTIGLFLENHLPRPAAVVASNMPCDGGMSQYTVIEQQTGAPVFRLDTPHQFHSERAVDYFAGELKRLIAWLEAQTPGRMDWDRMRAVCEQRNRATELEFELWDLLQDKPAPLAAETVYLPHLMYMIAQPGTEQGTRVFRRMVDLARKNRERHTGALPDERYRVALWNPPTMIFLDLFAWAEQAYGVSLIMDMLTYHRHPFIDTHTPETMLRDLAKVIMQGPMARHTRGPAENFFGDLFHFYERFDLQMIWMAGHIGCKNTQALNGMFREKCRKRGIPLLVIDYDLSDTRVVPPAEIRRQVEHFMETVMHADRLDR
jgi:hypothetical protein